MIERDATSKPDQQEYLQLVQREIDQASLYSQRQIRRHRLAQIVAIIVGLAVPVVTAWSAVPREVIGLLSAIAIAATGIDQLCRYQQSGTQAMVTANQLERELNRFVYGAGTYAEHKGFNVFVDRIEQIRESADSAFAETWRKPVELPSSGGSPPQVSS
ncbi:MAG: DUF4231 domain-containing protein [Actinoplanes sp.]